MFSTSSLSFVVVGVVVVVVVLTSRDVHGAYVYRHNGYTIRPIYLESVSLDGGSLAFKSESDSRVAESLALPRRCRLPDSGLTIRIRAKHCNLDSVNVKGVRFPQERYVQYVTDPRGSSKLVVSFVRPEGRVIIAFAETSENTYCAVYRAVNVSSNKTDPLNDVNALTNCSDIIMSNDSTAVTTVISSTANVPASVQRNWRTHPHTMTARLIKTTVDYDERATIRAIKRKTSDADATSRTPTSSSRSTSSAFEIDENAREERNERARDAEASRATRATSSLDDAQLDVETIRRLLTINVVLVALVFVLTTTSVGFALIRRLLVYLRKRKRERNTEELIRALSNDDLTSSGSAKSNALGRSLGGSILDNVRFHGMRVMPPTSPPKPKRRTFANHYDNVPRGPTSDWNDEPRELMPLGAGDVYETPAKINSRE